MSFVSEMNFIFNFIFCWHKHHRVSTKNFDANAEKELNPIRDYIGSSWNKDCVVCHFLYNFLHYFWSGIKNYLKNLNYQWWHNRERGVNNWQVSEVGRRLCWSLKHFYIHLLFRIDLLRLNLNKSFSSHKLQGVEEDYYNIKVERKFCKR